MKYDKEDLMNFIEDGLQFYQVSIKERTDRQFIVELDNKKYTIIVTEPDEYTFSSINLYDQEEIVENCTVHILTNSVTGDTSIGWWRGTKEDMP